jgi:DNA-binding cell septation regulator SpoVG
MTERLSLTDVEISLDKTGETTTRAHCTAIFNGVVKMDGIQIKEGVNGVYVAFPHFCASNGKKCPLLETTPAHRMELANRILTAYVVKNEEQLEYSN